MHAQALSRVRLCYPMDHSPPGSSVQGISQARVLEQVAISFSGGSSWPRDWACISRVSCTAGGFFTTEPPGKSWNRMSLNLMCLVSLKRKDSEQITQGEGEHAAVKARMSVALLQAKECQGLLTSNRSLKRQEWILPYRLYREPGPIYTWLLNF